MTGNRASSCASHDIGHVIGQDSAGVHVDKPSRPDRGAFPLACVPPSSTRRTAPSSPPTSTGTNAPFDPLCGATSYVSGYGARSVGSLKRAEGRVEQGPQQPCPNDPLGTWSRHGNPGDSRCLPSGLPLRSWPPWWPRPPWSPTTPHHPPRAGHPVARCRRSPPSRRRRPRRPPPHARPCRAPHAPRQPPSRPPPRSPPAGRPPRPDPPQPGRRPRLAARRPPGP